MAYRASSTTRDPAADRAGGGDWAAETADTIARLVGGVRDKTTGPLERASRIAVYGLLAAILGIAAAVLLAILVVRLIDIAIPGEVWPAHLITGGIFTLLGVFLWSKRSRATVSTKK